MQSHAVILSISVDERRQQIPKFWASFHAQIRAHIASKEFQTNTPSNFSYVQDHNRSQEHVVDQEWAPQRRLHRVRGNSASQQHCQSCLQRTAETKSPSLHLLCHAKLLLDPIVTTSSAGNRPLRRLRRTLQLWHHLPLARQPRLSG